MSHIRKMSSCFPPEYGVLALRTIDGAFVDDVAKTHDEGFAAAAAID